MSQQYDNTNKGAIFVNNRKLNDRHPDMNGKINIDGVEYWLSGWWKQGKSGEFLSLALGQRVEQQQEQAPQHHTQGRGRPQPTAQPAQDPASSNRFEDIDDDIPF